MLEKQSLSTTFCILFLDKPFLCIVYSLYNTVALYASYVRMRELYYNVVSCVFMYSYEHYMHGTIRYCWSWLLSDNQKRNARSVQSPVTFLGYKI